MSDSSSSNADDDSNFSYGRRQQHEDKPTAQRHSLFSRFAPSPNGNASSAAYKRIMKLSSNSDELTAEQSPLSYPHSSSPGVAPNDLESLEGTLFYKRGRSAGATTWQRRYVVLNLVDGGSVTCYDKNPPASLPPVRTEDHQSQQQHQQQLEQQSQHKSDKLRTMYSKVHRRMSSMALNRHMSTLNLQQSPQNGNSLSSPHNAVGGVASASSSPGRSRNSSTRAEFQPGVLLHIPSHVNWLIKDIINDSASFVLEIATSQEQQSDDDDSFGFVPLAGDDASEFGGSTVAPFGGADSVGSNKNPQDALRRDWMKARHKGKPLRFYFKCPKSGNEKDLWLRAFSGLDRLSAEYRRKKGFLNLGLLSSPYAHWTHSRIRSPTSAELAKETRQLDTLDINTSNHTARQLVGKPSRSGIDFNVNSDLTLGGNRSRHSIRTAALSMAASKDDDRTDSGLHSSVKAKARGDKEYRVVPYYAYPHRWMTPSEMREEMMLPSVKFHDLRLFHPKQQNSEIGALQVEVLQCLGLPKLDRNSETDAVVYMVSGSYAFATDVIDNRANPMWLRKTRRACIFPLFHAYARLYVCVFDDDGKSVKDDVAGRVVIDVARLRANSTYDVTLPLRLSSHVYTRRKRGAIRLRFSLTWKSERAALLSYLPKQIRLHRRGVRPDNDTTVLCGDAKAFRNVALTVHGVHLPGRFSFQQLRATLREVNFTRKMVMTTVRELLREIRQWKNPALTGFLFLGWMHCIYADSFALVPAYFMSFCLLLLLRNYARYAINRAVHRGFMPATIEEMWMALFARGTGGGGDTFDESGGALRGSIEPLDFAARYRHYHRASSRSYIKHNSSLDGSNHSFTYSDARYKTHEPKGKAMFRLMGFLQDDDEDGMAADDEHMEFPFGTGIDYPKFSVRESLRPTRHRKKEKDTEPGSDDAGSYTEGKVETPFLARFDMVDIPELVHKDSGGESEYDDEEEEFDHKHRPAGWIEANHHRDACGGVAQNANHMRDDDDVAASAIQRADKSESPQVQFPDQNVDVRGPVKNLTDDLADIKEKISEFAFHLFADRSYVVKHPQACSFGQARRSEKRRKVDVSKDLDKLLNTGQYSHNNPVVSRVGLYVEPMVGSAQIFLCAFRSLFNALTWQDPFLTFWITLLVAIFVVVLFVFPWRLFLFVVGLVVLGPQNWLFRILRERNIYPRRRGDHLNDSSETPIKSTTEGSGDDSDQNIQWTDQPIFSCHVPVNDQPKELRHSQANSREIHHVVVPYSPLMYYRFYDWPPESQFADVVPDVNGDALRRLNAHNNNQSLNRGSYHSRNNSGGGCGGSLNGGGASNGISPSRQGGGGAGSSLATWKTTQSSFRSIKSDRAPTHRRSLFASK